MWSRSRQYRSFLLIVATMTVVWFAVALSSTRTYNDNVSVSYTGIDTARYVVLVKDSVLPVTVTGDGFAALFHHWMWKGKSLSVSLQPLPLATTGRKEQNLAIVSDEYMPELSKNFSPIGKYEVKPNKDTLKILIRERKRRTYVPQLRGVTFSFAEGYGLKETPTMSPSKVTLYGSEQSLSQIEAIYTKPAEVSVGAEGGKVRLDLEPVWKEYPDVRTSHNYIYVSVPTGAYVETKKTVKVELEGTNIPNTFKLYPDQVSVSAWVPQDDYFDMADIRAVVRLEPNESRAELPVSIIDFPSNIRIRNIEPEKVQYVIIK